MAGLTWLTGWFVVGVPLVALAGEVALAAAIVGVMSTARPLRAVAAPMLHSADAKTS